MQCQSVKYKNKYFPDITVYPWYFDSLLFLDPRKQEFVQGRSINLALSVRGIEALKGAGAHHPVRIITNLLIIIQTNKKGALVW